jgi:hypothetical protein
VETRAKENKTKVMKVKNGMPGSGRGREKGDVGKLIRQVIEGANMIKE